MEINTVIYIGSYFCSARTFGWFYPSIFGSLILVFESLTWQETNNLFITIEFLKDEEIDFSHLEHMIQFEVPRKILNNLQEFDKLCLERFLKLSSLRILSSFQSKDTHIYISPLCLFKIV